MCVVCIRSGEKHLKLCLCVTDRIRQMKTLPIYLYKNNFLSLSVSYESRVSGPEFICYTENILTFGTLN